ncbi:MAG TPA: hypothetical protein ENN29_09610 [Candidatus Hydrogenedentes bacterium]|nr:hypothetical protein [Candidatus Hydrogenedentota bacterium]
MNTRLSSLCCCILAPFFLVCPDCRADKGGLAVETSSVGKSYLSYKGAPLLAFGPGDEMRIVSGAADAARWVKWQRDNGMNLVRAYPASVPIEAYGAPGLAPFLKRDGKWDVDAFDDAYFTHLGDVAKMLEENDVILHLQLWQIVFFKDGERRWDINFLNPRNNVNEWTQGFSQGRAYIDAPDGSAARAHQQRWVRHILDALKGRGNVIIDVINELGNAMGTLEWAVDVTRWIRAWEAENDWSFIVGVDSERHYTPEQFGAQREHFDIIILNELQRRERGMNIIAAFNMPAVSVRSSDGTNQWDDYLFAGPDQTGPEHQTRYRTLCYRSIFAGLQSVGAYWKSEVQVADYGDMEHWPGYARALRAFWEILSPHWPSLTPVAAEGRVEKAVTPHVYLLDSPAFVALYLECGSHTWNNEYATSTLRVACEFSDGEARFFNPRTGTMELMAAEYDGGAFQLSLPPFTDDAVVLISRAGA